MIRFDFSRVDNYTPPEHDPGPDETMLCTDGRRRLSNAPVAIELLAESFGQLPENLATLMRNCGSAKVYGNMIRFEFTERTWAPVRDLIVELGLWQGAPQ